jgi:ankyrin repeat protein
LVYTAAFKSIERSPTAEAAFWDEAIGKHFTSELAWVSRIAHGSSAPVSGAAGSTSTAAAPAISPGGTDATTSNDVFVSAVCVDVNKVKARANGQPKEAAEIARLVCQTVMTDWETQGCRENPDQPACRKRLASFDGSLKSSGSSMLFAAAQAGQTSICSVMLATGSDPNAVTSTGWTPLMIAAAENRPATVKLLLDKGASLEAKNADGKTPAALAAESGHPEIVELLTKGSAEMPSHDLAAAGAPLAAPEAQLVIPTSRGDARLEGNVPADRLKGNMYTSADGAFELSLPTLIMPGAKGEERQIGQGQQGVFFADDLGNTYYVIRTDNTQLKYDLEKIAEGYTINEALREKQIVPTARGSELRMAGVMPGGSPIAKETKVKQETVVQKLDLHQAMSLFVTDTDIYEVAAGVTATHQEADADMIARAKERLDAFLGGLRIKEASPPAN